MAQEFILPAGTFCYGCKVVPFRTLEPVRISTHPINWPYLREEMTHDENKELLDVNDAGQLVNKDGKVYTKSNHRPQPIGAVAVAAPEHVIGGNSDNQKLVVGN